MSDRKFRIHDVAKRLKISTQSIRNYEKRGLFPPPRTDEKGWRYYTEDDINKIIAYYYPAAPPRGVMSDVEDRHREPEGGRW